MLRNALVAAAVCSCGRVNFDPLGDAAGCPPGYTPVADGCYRFVINPGLPLELDWLMAEQTCELDGPGAHLLVIDSSAEANVATDALGDGGAMNAWVGVSDRISQGTYLAVTGEPAFLLWASAEPTGLGDCVQLLAEGGMVDRSCVMTNDYLCEYDGKPVVPASF